jgi:hypothetical protein
MARTPNDFCSEKKKILIDEIKKNTPFEIRSHRDCQKLSEFIFSVHKKNISASTLRRLFGFEQSAFQPSPFTVEILEKYIDHQKQTKLKSIETSAFILEMFDPIHFKKISSNDESFHAVYRKAAMLINSNEQLFFEVMEDLASMPNGRMFYYELFPDYEILPKFQYKGYERYLEYSSSKNDRVFALTLLIWAACQRNNVIDYKKWSDLLVGEDPTYAELHPFVLGRYIACMLIHSASKLEYEKWRDVAIQLAQKLLPQEDIAFAKFPGFHYFVSDALQEKKDGKVLLQLIELVEKNYPRVEEFEWKGYYEQLDLFKAFALYFLGRKEESLHIFTNIDFSNFYFISKDYFMEKYHTLRELLTLK